MTIIEERLAEIAAHAAVVFGGNVAAALLWLKTPQAAIGGNTPASLLMTDYGFSQVMKLLGNLGVVSHLAA